MNFLHPATLIALATLAIPIVIHLFNFRRTKRVEFSDIRFLKEIKQQTDSKAKLKHLLTLLCRCLALAFMVMAFAQPFFPGTDPEKNLAGEVTSIYIDNSYSMEARNKEGSLMDEAIRKARTLAQNADLNMRFQLLTNDFEGKQQRLVDREEFLRLLDEIKISPATRRMDEVQARQKDLLMSTSGPKQAYWLSDFQKNTINAEKITLDTVMKVTALPVGGAKSGNLAIDSLWFISPIHKADETEQLVVRIRNYGEEDAGSVPIKLTVNGMQKAIGSLSLKAKTSAMDTLTYKPGTSGWQKGLVELTDYPITFDDKMFFSYLIDEQLNVLLIEGTAAKNYAKTVYETDNYFKAQSQNEQQIDFGIIPQQRLVVLNQLTSISTGLQQALHKFTEGGGSLLIFPDLKADAASYNQLLGALNAPTLGAIDPAGNKTVQLNMQSPVFGGLFESIPQNPDLPMVKKSFNINPNSRSRTENLLSMQGGKALMTRTQTGLGNVYLSAVPLDDSVTNLPRHALFLPMLYKMAMMSSQRYPLYSTVGRDRMLETTKLPPSDKNEYRLKGMGLEFIPDIRNGESSTNLYIDDQIRQAGIYTFASAEKETANFAFNYDRSESNLSFYSPEDLPKVLGPKLINTVNASADVLGKTLEQQSNGQQLWKYFIILALVFLAFEMLIIRFFDRLIVTNRVRA